MTTALLIGFGLSPVALSLAGVVATARHRLRLGVVLAIGGVGLYAAIAIAAAVMGG